MMQELVNIAQTVAIIFAVVWCVRKLKNLDDRISRIENGFKAGRRVLRNHPDLFQPKSKPLQAKKKENGKGGLVFKAGS